MKNILSLGALAALALLAVGSTGCGDDPVANNLNPHFEPKKGDTFTYARYDRDMNNQRVTDSKTIHKWVVLDANISYQGKTEVARILQMNFEADGTTSRGANDTLYIRSGTDGQIFMDVIAAAMKRVPAAADLAAQIPFIWLQVTDTKSSNTYKYEAAAKIADVTLNGFPLRITFKDTAYHKGKADVTINSKAYTGVFHTDHTLRMLATSALSPSPIINNDSLHMTFNFDNVNGLLRQTLSSDTITLAFPAPLGTQQELVPGFEFEFVSAVRK